MKTTFFSMVMNHFQYLMTDYDFSVKKVEESIHNSENEGRIEFESSATFVTVSGEQWTVGAVLGRMKDDKYYYFLDPRTIYEYLALTDSDKELICSFDPVATNEFEHAWMDEGLNTFSTARTLEQSFGPQHYSKRYFGGFVPWVFDDLPLNRATVGNRLSGYRDAANVDTQSTPTWRYWPGTAAAITYNKTALWLNTLERMLGWETLQKILSTYFARFSFKHPEPRDFFAVANEVSGRDLTWFFDQVYRSSSVFDYKVDTFTSERISDRGYFGDASRQKFSADERSGDLYHTTLVVRRAGDGVFPVGVRILFENGQEQRWLWDGRERWRTFEADRPVRAVRAEVDPERVLLLDVNYTNNSQSLAPKTDSAARKWSLVWLIWLQDHLLTYGFFI